MKWFWRVLKFALVVPAMVLVAYWPQHAFLLRVPLALAAFLVLLPFLGLKWSKPLAAGLFDCSPAQTFIVALAAVAAAGSVAMNASIVLAYGPLRMGLKSSAPVTIAGGCWLFWVALLSLPVMVGVWIMASQQKNKAGDSGLAGVLGLAVGLGISWLIIDQWSNAAGNGMPAGDWMLFGKLNVGPGYVDSNNNLLPKHEQARWAFGIVAAVYLLVGACGWWRLNRPGKTTRMVPALASALMIATLLCWICAPLAFLFDASRFPFLLVLAVWGAITGRSVKSDHFYRLQLCSAPPPTKPSPKDVIRGAKKIIVVAANGGGIQSAAWAAQVLYGLATDCPKCGKEFRQALKLISAVSGGSVGTMFFVDWLNRGATQGVDPVETAQESSLDGVSWALAWTDFLRGFFPWLLGGFSRKDGKKAWIPEGVIGRGRVLEGEWSFNAGGTPLREQPLSNWWPSEDNGLPAIILNTTEVETGDRVLFATSTMGNATREGRARKDADALHCINSQQYDVPVATAARLSASFPYVTPAARSDAPGARSHLVDGGYYDNYGMATLVEWLDDALTNCDGCKPEVLVIQILGAPVSAQSNETPESRGWFFQALAPLLTLVNVRGSGQFAHNTIELDLLKEKWKGEKVTIDSVQFEFPDPDAPLSWHLTGEQKRAIHLAWRDQHRKQAGTKIGGARAEVCKFLSRHCPDSSITA